ncbi:MAG: DUF1329 domain-containing protein [Deltaproteobacteria bacterium]|nr:MAG: DUF1329 domain-containing protein [Deltaproteobacteria bacterium]
MPRRIIMIILAGLITGILFFYSTPIESELAPDQLLTKENWTEMVGFKPDLALGDFKSGDLIDKTNWEKVKDVVPETLLILIKKYNMKLKIGDYKPVHPSKGYIDATNKYCRQVEIWDTKEEARKKGIKDYLPGLPFPNPQNGLEIAWNYHFSYQADDADNRFGVYWISAKKGVERWEEWKWLYITRTINRTDIEPLPAIPEFAQKGIQYASMTYALEPYDKKGLAALYNRFDEPRDQEGWLYIPTMRRVLRASFGTRGDSWNSTDLLYEDVRGYMGYPEWMHWKLVGKRTVLAPMHAGIPISKDALNKVYDFKNWPHWNPNMTWERRPVYVVEATPKFPDYPYSKMVLYYDAETFYITYKEAYDKKGELWKILINAFNESPEPDREPPSIGTCLVVDLQAEHATAFPWFDQVVNKNLDPSLFTITNLRKLGK